MQEEKMFCCILFGRYQQVHVSKVIIGRLNVNIHTKSVVRKYHNVNGTPKTIGTLIYGMTHLNTKLNSLPLKTYPKGSFHK